MKQKPTIPTAVLATLFISAVLTQTAFGENVTWTYKNGNRYEGESRDGKQHGRGISTWPNGDRYEGEFRDGKLYGHGIYTWPNGNRYEGEFRDGERYGHGIYTSVNGDRYEGEFRNNKRHGEGVLTYSDGSRYEGQFKDGDPYDYANSSHLEKARACIDIARTLKAYTTNTYTKSYTNTCNEPVGFFHCYEERGRYEKSMCGRPNIGASHTWGKAKILLYAYDTFGTGRVNYDTVW